MAENGTKLLKYLFPEHQVIACIEERGFIARAAHGRNRPSLPEKPVQKAQAVQQAPPHEQKTPSFLPEKPVQKAPSVQQTPPVQRVPAVPQTIPAHEAMEAPLSRARVPAKASSVQQTDPSRRKPYTPVKIDDRFRSRANDAFDGLSDALKKYWPGSEKGRVAICRAFQRPYIRGFDIRRSRNAILLISPGCGELVHAVRGVSELLQQRKVFRYAEVSTMNFGQYVSDVSNALFVNDLHTAFTADTETVLFEHIEQASSSQLNIIYQLLSEGRYGKDGQDIGEADTGRTPETAVNGKYIVFTTTVPQAKITAFLGNQFVREIGDIIVLGAACGH